MSDQLALFDLVDITDQDADANHNESPPENPPEIDLHSYDYYIVMMSGGKDSLACFLHLLDAGVPLEKIELWHHCVDGKDNPNPLFDWPVTEDYVRKLAEAFNVPLYFSWKEGGFEGEMLRENERTKPTWFETPNGTFKSGGTQGKLGTRLKFPQVTANLNQRWCSAYLKVDPASKAITNQMRFCHSRTLVVTGERAQESKARSHYAEFEPDRADRRNGRNGRHVDHYRPIHAWDEQEVWDVIKRYGVRMHPAYRLGWGRLSCMTCIFGSPNQWASVKAIDPDRFERIAQYEDQFGVTIHRTRSVRDQVERGEAYESISKELASQAMQREFTESIFVDEWELPAGAFGESTGPT